MTHLTLDQLLALREPGTEPGHAAAREHLATCGACRAERDRLDQRVARLKALPALRPSRDGWHRVHARLEEERASRRRRRTVIGALGGLAMAAGLAGVLIVGTGAEPQVEPTEVAEVAGELQSVRARSQALEAAIQEYEPASRVTDGRTDRLAQDLEIRIAELDRRLDMTELSEDAARDAQLLRLWEERVGLLDALVDVHVTRASNVGL
jgi:hypothetical protein